MPQAAAFITGSALLALALGWAVLAVLTAGLIDQPQRWAWVPGTSRRRAAAAVADVVRTARTGTPVAGG